MKSLGESLRDLRTSKGLLIRQVAFQLDIDPSLLSRIERGNKRPTRKQVVKLSTILCASEHDLMACYLKERVLNMLKDEPLALKVIVMAEKQMLSQKR